MERLIKDIRIISSRKKFMKPLAKEEFDLLAQQINNEGGINTPIDIDQDNGLLDGHNRLAIAKKMGLDKVPVIVHNLASEELAETFMTERQVGRRNITTQERDKYLRLMYERLKGKKGAPKGNTNAKGGSGKKETTVEKVAKKANVTPAIVKGAIERTKPDGSPKPEKAKPKNSIMDEAYREVARAFTILRSRYVAHPDTEFREWIERHLSQLLKEGKANDVKQMTPTEIQNANF